MSDHRHYSPDPDSHLDPHREGYDPNRSYLTRPLANILSNVLPGLGMPSPAMAGTQRTYAPWPVWRDSTTAKVKFAPVKKKDAVKWFHKARHFERQTRQPGKQDGALGRNGLAVLHTLIFDILNYATGRLDPALETIAHKACISVSSVKRGLAKLKQWGLLHWIRRAAETRDEKGRFCLEQDTNAYGLIPPAQWLGFRDAPEPPPPEPDTWGATPPLPSVLEQATEELRHGGDRAVQAILESDPQDEFAHLLANFRRLVVEREAQEAQKPR
jgi:hypothetical protein